MCTWFSKYTVGRFTPRANSISLRRFGHRPSQRFLADNGLELGARFDRVDNLLDHLQPHEVRHKDGHHVHVGNHLADALVNASFAQPVLAGEGNQVVQRVLRHKPRHLDAVNLPQGLQLKPGDESAADKSVP